MADLKNFFRIPTPEEHSELQRKNPDAILIPMSEQQLKKNLEILKKLHEEEEKFPLLKQTDESLTLFSLRSDFNRHHLQFLEALEYISIIAAIQNWLVTLKEETRLKYAEYMTDMLKRQIIPASFADGQVFTIGGFRHIRHEEVLKYISKFSEWTEHSRQARAACYISFTAYLHSISFGWFRRALPSDEEINKTFYRLRPKAIINALSIEEWHDFIQLLDKSNPRDSLIARCILWGGHRVSEVLNIRLDQINFEQNIIRFSQKSRNRTVEIPQHYPADFISELKKYIDLSKEYRSGSNFVFVTRNGHSLTRSRLNYSFAHASAQVKIAKITPEILRASWAMFDRNDIINEDILKVANPIRRKEVADISKTEVNNVFDSRGN